MTNTPVRPPQSATDYTVACICPMGVELAPVEGMLDEIHDSLPIGRGQNVYTLGKLGAHNVVVTIMPETGTTIAATVATQLLNDFPAVHFSLLVGIGGGVPGSVDVRLGDVVVSQATDTFGGVVQYDLGKRTDKGSFQRTGFLNKPPAILSASVRKLDSQYRRQGSKMSTFISEMLQRYPTMQTQYSYPSMAKDDLFCTSYSHQLGENGDECENCDQQMTMQRPTRANHEARVHYGTIGSANIVLKDATLRDQLHADTKILCVEMEAAGLMNDFPCLVIRGICDYADSHKNKRWQAYAAAVAAAYMKELLLIIPSQQVTRNPNTVNVKDSINEHFDVPHLLSPVFTIRDEICQQLETALVLASEPRKPAQRRFVLFGLGGSGKTQVCLHYAQTHRKRYWAVFWVDASTTDSIQQSMVQIGLMLEVETNINSVKRALSRLNQPWLLVLDNADDPDLSLSPYLPTGDGGDIVITSRNPGCRHYHTVGYSEIGPMSSSSSLDLLYKIVYGDSNPIKTDQNCGQSVVDLLGYLALAVTQAGAYIRETACTFDQYLEIYRWQCQKLLAYYPNHNGTDYHYTVYTTWQVSLDRIAAMQDATSKAATKLLQLLCFYNHDQIPRTMFHHAWYYTTRVDSTAANAAEWDIWPNRCSNVFDFHQAMQASVTLLNSFSLVTRDADVSLSLHPLVRDWCQARLDKETRLSCCQQAISLLATSVRWEFTAEDHTYRRSLAPHVHACIRSHHSMGGNLGYGGSPHEWEVLALILAENKNIHDAMQLTQQVMQRLKSTLGDENPHTIGLMHTLAARYAAAGRHHDALELMEKVVQLQKSKRSEGDPSLPNAMHGLALRYSEVGRYDEAFELAQQVVKSNKSQLGQDHPNTMDAIHSLALRYFDVRRHEESFKLMVQVIQQHKSVLGDDHPKTIRALHNLFALYGLAGWHEEAIQLGEKVVEVRKKHLGEEHPDTCVSMFNLAIRYHDVGRHEEALQLQERVLRLRKSKLGEDHLDTIVSMHELAFKYSNEGRYDEAIQLAERVVQLWKSRQRDETNHLSKGLYCLAHSYSQVGRHEEAVQVTKEMIQSQKDRVSKEDPNMHLYLEMETWVTTRAAEAQLESLRIDH